MRISKLEYANYKAWEAGRYGLLELRDAPYKYKGGEIRLSDVLTKRAIQVNVYYKNIGYHKIFDIPCDVLAYEKDVGKLPFERKIVTKKMYIWRDTEAFKLAIEFGQGIIDCLEMLEEAMNDPNSGFCKPIYYKIITDCKSVEDEQIKKGGKKI